MIIIGEDNKGGYESMAENNYQQSNHDRCFQKEDFMTMVYGLREEDIMKATRETTNFVRDEQTKENEELIH